MKGKIVIVGASGLVGHAALKHFAALADWEAVGVSRRQGLPGIRSPHYAVDLLNRTACQQFGARLKDVTHVVYAALAGEGWNVHLLAEDQLRMNLEMLKNVIEALETHARGFRHISVVHGTNAYGSARLGELTFRIPLRESDPRPEGRNFYHMQEDFLLEAAKDASWSYTIWRPVSIFGEAFGCRMNPIPALSAYATLLHNRGEPLYYPGNPDWVVVREAIDSEILAQAFEWAAHEPIARSETYNITNGDVFVWQELWPAIAEALGMEVGPPRPTLLRETMPRHADEWAQTVEQYNLRSPSRLDEFAGDSFTFLDRVFGDGQQPGTTVLLSPSVKLRTHGFEGCTDTQEMIKKWFKRMRESEYIPTW
jgi:nucleoside-diphosphate-sugar epimerase